MEIHKPTTVDALADLIRQHPVIFPVGGRTMLDYGAVPSKPGVEIDMTGLDRVLDFPARDMTITVEAGMTVAKLNDIIRPENLQLPIDVPHPERAAIGGILACNVSGARRYGYGTLRDYLLGFSALNDQGQLWKAGGRVVKNVAGYDLCKLIIGSLGTLGVITQATFKLKPPPEEQKLLRASLSPGELASALDKVHTSRTRPTLVELFQFSGSGWSLYVGFEGNAELARWQVEQLRREFHPVELVEETSLPTMPDVPLVVKASVLPSRVADLCVALSSLTPRPNIRAHAANGIVIASFPEADAKVVERVRSWAGEGHAVVLRAPANLRDAAFVWGPPDGTARIQRRIKEQFDPQGKFNPGRYQP